MEEYKVASRYAKSLLSIALDNNVLEQVQGDMKEVRRICTEDSEVEEVLKSSMIQPDKKRNVITAAFDDQISSVSAAFISILINMEREGILLDIVDEFEEVCKERQNKVVVSIISAAPLSKEQRDNIISLLKEQGMESFELKEVIDDSIKENIVIKINDKQVDKMIKQKLHELKSKLN